MKIKRIALIVLLLGSSAAWALFEPIRVLAPKLVADVSCPTATVCIDDIVRYKEAADLYNDTLHFVESSVASVKTPPRVVFCTTESCFQSFGFDKASAGTVGTYGIVISPRGWRQHYLCHEMIHHIQFERLGIYKQWRSPEWFKEGMAYSLSGDPRQVLAEPWQQYRARFEDWYRAVGKSKLWEAAQSL